MILDVDPEAATVDLLDHDVLTRFHVAVHRRREGELTGVDKAVRTIGAGRVDGSEVLVAVDWLRAHASEPSASAWGARFDAMLAYSASRGWVEQSSLRAHCEWPDEPKFAVLDFTRTAHRERRVHAGFQRYAAADLVAHGLSGAGSVRGREAVAGAALAWQRDSGRFEVCQLVADGDMVAVHARHTSRDDAPGNDLIDLYRVSDGRIVEWWRVGGG